MNQDKIRWWRKNIIGLMLMAFLLLFSAGEFRWPAAWLYLGCSLLIVIANAFFADPELLSERSRLQEGTVKWDLFLSPFVAIFGPLLLLAIAGFDRRDGWSGQFLTGIQYAALLLFLAGGLLATWAMSENRFFSATVRLQKERGHSVTKSGPYRYVRHPGYSGGIVSIIAAPILLGSWYALSVALLVAVGYIVRTVLEDAYLLSELEGYRQYSVETPYRLLPGIW